MRLSLRMVARTMARNWTQFSAVLLMALASVLVYAGLEGGWRGLELSIEQFTSENRLADAWLSASTVSDEDLAALAGLDGVQQVQSVLSFAASDEATDGNLQLGTIGGDIDQPVIIEGAPLDPDDDGGLWLDLGYARAHEISPGDQLGLTVLGNRHQLIVRGLILTPDKLFYTARGAITIPDATRYGYAVVSPATANATLGRPMPDNQIAIIGDAAVVRVRAPEILGERYLGFADRTTQPEVATAFDRPAQLRSLSIMFAVVFLLLTVLSMQSSIKRLIDMQRTEIATMRALGYSSASIGALYLGYGLVCGGLGAAIGLALAPLMAGYVLANQQIMFALPSWRTAWTLGTPALVTGVVAVCAAAAWFASAPGRRQVPAAGLRPATPGGRQLPLEAVAWFWNRLGNGTRWAMRDAWGSPVRLALGVVAVTGSMMLLTAGFGMPNTMVTMIEKLYAESYRYAAAITPAPEASASDRDRLAELAGPDAQWQMLVPARTIPDDGFDRSLTVLAAGELIALASADGPIELADGAVASEGAAAAWGAGVGETVWVRAPGDSQYRPVVITAIVNIAAAQGIYISQDEWERLGGTFAPNVLLAGDDWDEDALRADSGVLDIGTLAEQRASAEELPRNLGSVYKLMKGFAALLAVVALANLGALSFTERARQYATMQVLGMRIGEIRGLVFAENIATTLIGWSLGVPAGWWFLQRYVAVFENPAVRYTAAISPLDYALATTLVLVSALSATALLSRRIRGLDMVGALKGVE